jgi:hypothetical protein
MARGPEEEAQTARVDLLVFLAECNCARGGRCGCCAGVEGAWNHLEGRRGGREGWNNGTTQGNLHMNIDGEAFVWRLGTWVAQ